MRPPGYVEDLILPDSVKGECPGFRPVALARTKQYQFFFFFVALGCLSNQFVNLGFNCRHKNSIGPARAYGFARLGVVWNSLPPGPGHFYRPQYNILQADLTNY